MKNLEIKILINVVCFAMFINNVSAQDLINPYSKSYTLSSELFVKNTPVVNDPYKNEYDMLFVNGSQAPNLPPLYYYTGEYEISLQGLPWFTYFPANMISFQYKVVSFPFTMDCAFSANGCAVANNVPLPHYRNLYLPNVPYIQTDNVWDYGAVPNLSNLTPLKAFFPSGMSNTSSPAYAHSLVSTQFVSNGGNSPSRKILPHTAIEQTINIHCGPLITDNIISSIKWVYDNTRGKMNEYPFVATNYNLGAQPGKYDQIFIPQIVQNQYLFDYDISKKISYQILPYETINYFPYNEIPPAGCLTIPRPSSIYQDFFATNSNLPYTYYYIYPNYNALYTHPLRQFKGEFIAGYEQGLGNNPQPIQGLRHTYQIDQNIDLTIINPTEQTIYNPSEVDVTASDLHLPSYYTFKTIRGVYPSIANVTADNNDPQTGGPYADPRDVPVRTDLRSENTNDPQDPNTPWHSVYSSRYYLKTGCKLTIEPCVNIFDATFDVEEGATLVFENQQYNLGFEHKKLNQTQNLGRYKIKGLGGAILRNYNATQYVQNGKITQPYNLHYIATSTILAGATVAAIVDDDDQPIGNYTIEPVGDVQFTAPDLISLRDGFSAKTGCTFKAKCEDPGLLPDCPQQFNGNGGSKMMQNHFQPNANILFDGIVTPNPNDGLFTYRANNFSHENNCTVEIINSIGLKLISKEIVSENIFFDLSKYGKGVYFLKVMNGTKIKIEKVVVH